MAKVRLSVFMFPFVLSFALQSQAQELEGDPIFNDPAYYQIASIEVLDSNPLTLVTDIPKGIGSDLCGSHPPAGLQPFSSLKGIGISLETIINIGKTLWEIVKANKATIDIKLDAATAIPQGIRCWSDLGNFANARSEYKTILIKNFARMRAVEFKYRMIWLPGGSYKNKGKYIGYATMIPADVYVIGGWKFSAQASMPAVYNTGSTSSPVGGLNMNMVYRAESPFSLTEQSQSYEVDGQGNFREL